MKERKKQQGCGILGPIGSVFQKELALAQWAEWIPSTLGE